jgi:hypothetical protein
MKDASLKPIESLNASGPPGSSLTLDATSYAPNMPTSTTEAGSSEEEPNLKILICIVVRLHGPITLEQLLPALLVQYPHKQPAEIHDTINTLLAEGFLILGRLGTYCAR